MVLQKGIFSVHTKAVNQWISTEKLHSMQRKKKKHPKTLRESEECMCLCVSGGFGHGLVLVYCLSLLPGVEDRPELTERNL